MGSKTLLSRQSTASVVTFLLLCISFSVSPLWESPSEWFCCFQTQGCSLTDGFSPSHWLAASWPWSYLPQPWCHLKCPASNCDGQNFKGVEHVHLPLTSVGCGTQNIWKMRPLFSDLEPSGGSTSSNTISLKVLAVRRQWSRPCFQTFYHKFLLWTLCKPLVRKNVPLEFYVVSFHCTEISHCSFLSCICLFVKVNAIEKNRGSLFTYHAICVCSKGVCACHFVTGIANLPMPPAHKWPLHRHNIYQSISGPIMSLSLLCKNFSWKNPFQKFSFENKFVTTSNTDSMLVLV